MFKPITIEEIKNRLVFSHDQVFHVVIKQDDSKNIFTESFTFTKGYHVIVMDNHNVSWSPLGTIPQDFNEYILSLNRDVSLEVLGFYEYETE